MVFRSAVLLAALLLCFAAACGGGGPEPAGDAGGDTSAPPDGATNRLVVEAPSFLPCPEGWAAADIDGGEGADGVSRCQPWPRGARPECELGAAPLPASGGCVHIGSPCPEGDAFPPEFVDGPGIAFVGDNPGAVAPPSGTRADPYLSIPAAIFHPRAPDGSLTIYVAAGVYDLHGSRIREDTTLRGVCASEVLIASDFRTRIGGTIDVAGDDVTLRDLTIANSPSPGIWIGWLADSAVEGERLLQAGGSLHLEDVVVDGTGGVGIFVGRDATVTGRRVLVENTDGDNFSDGLGVLVYGGGAAAFDDSAFVDNRYAGVAVQDADLELTRSVVAGTSYESSSDQANGFGILATRSGLRLREVLVEDNSEMGIQIAGPTSLTDVLVRDTDAVVVPGSETSGVGIGIFSSPDVSLTRVAIEGSQAAALTAGGANTVVVASHLLLSGTRSNPTTGRLGAGLAVVEGARMEVDHARLAQNRDTSVFVSLAGAYVGLREVEILDSLSAACADDTCTDNPSGHGVFVGSGGSMSAEGFRISRANLCGVMLVPGGDLALAQGEISGAAIGACVTDSDFDLGRIQIGIRYLDNGTNLDSRSLPVPQSLTGELFDDQYR